MPVRVSQGAQVGKPVPLAAPDSPHRPPRTSFPVVGVGASAGGLEALKELFEDMPADLNISFVVITHQHPGHISLLPELLRKHTRLKVVETTDGIKLAPNQLYLGPPGGHLALLNGHLQFMDPIEPSDQRMPVDYFLRTLAHDQRELAICLVLSGTGTDGTLGLREIKANGGMAMVQAPESAKYSGMPASAIRTELVDFILPPSAMPAQLIAYSRGLQLHSSHRDTEMDQRLLLPMQKIFVLLRNRSGHDFSGYKPSTIRRRIERRMIIHQIKDPQTYLRFLQDTPHELDLLFKELLINVTSFFRDPAAYQSLADALDKWVFATKSANQPLRVWVPGCGTGEEAYSIAMLIQESMQRLNKHFDVQIFGTDLDKNVIEHARTGRYPEGIASDVGKKRLERFFKPVEDGYRINNEIREMVVLAPQNILQDPPFTKLDLISCRNLLIYLNAELQKQLLPMFHYALRPDGLLFLGPSETIGTSTGLFHPEDKRWKIFRRNRIATAPPVPELPTWKRKITDPMENPPQSGETLTPVQLSTLVERMLVDRYAPTSLVVNDRGDILYIHGRTGAYLEPASGHPRMNVLEMAREGLRLELATALRQAATRKKEILQTGLRVASDGGCITVDLSIHRIREPETLRGLTLITFHPLPSPKKITHSLSKASKSKHKQSRVAEMERELQQTRKTLQATVEELETSNEELKSTNEELQSTNEELQSTNEELETSKEEMQSLNEELTTVNTELQGKVEDLSQSNDDMQNLLNSTEIATIFLDNKLNIKRFTKQAKKLVHLINSDVGRPIGDLVNELQYADLVADARQVMQSLVLKEAEVQTTDGDWCLMRMVPYRTADNVIDGLVVTFVDINRLKKTEQAFGDAESKLNYLLSQSPVVSYSRECKGNCRITRIGENVKELTGYRASEFLNRPGFWIEHLHPEDKDRVWAALRDTSTTDTREVMYRFLCKDGRRIWLRDHFRMVRGAEGNPQELTGSMTEAKPENLPQ